MEPKRLESIFGKLRELLDWILDIGMKAQAP